jgi:hypothetical protein
LLPPLNFWCSSSLDFMRDPVQEAVTTLLALLFKAQVTYLFIYFI